MAGNTLDAERLGIPGLVAMELLQGCRNRAEQRYVESLLRPYRLYWPTEMDCMRAYGDFTAHYLSTGIGLLDALIAEIAMGLGAKLATFNEGHYRAVAALKMHLLCSSEVS